MAHAAGQRLHLKPVRHHLGHHAPRRRRLIATAMALRLMLRLMVRVMQRLTLRLMLMLVVRLRLRLRVRLRMLPQVEQTSP